MMKIRSRYHSLPITALLLSLGANPGVMAGNPAEGPRESRSAPAPSGADLELTIHYFDDSVVAGGRAAVQFIVKNHGPESAADARVETLLPAGLTLVSRRGCNEDSRWAPACAVGTLVGGQSALIELVFEAGVDHAGRLSVSALGQTDQHDPYPANNSEEATIEVVAPTPGAADLELSLISTEGDGRARGTVRSLFRVSNHGPDVAEGVWFHHPRPPNLSNIAVQGCSSRPAGCYLGDLGPGSERELTVTASVGRFPAGPIDAGTSVISWRSDPNPGNNRIPAGPLPADEYPLQIHFDGAGFGSVLGLPGGNRGGLRCTPRNASCESRFSAGSVVTLTPQPARGSLFVGWGGDCVVGSHSRSTLTMDGPKQCTARFDRLPTLTVTITGSGQGEILSDPGHIRCAVPADPRRRNICSYGFEPGTQVTLTAHPALGSIFDHWSGDPGCESGSVVLDGNWNCTAHFSLWETPPADSGMLSGGYRHSIARADDGSVWSWGNNINGELGDGTTVDVAVPQLLTGLPPVRQVAANNHHSGALDWDGQVWQWGSDQHGDLGLGGDNYYSYPLPVEGLPRIVQFTTGYYTHAAIAEDGTVWTWGPDWYGQMGDGQFNGSPDAAQVSGLDEVVAVASGGHHNLALRADGSVWAWGRNQHGQVGNGTTENSNLPLRVEGLADVVQIAAGASFSLALSADGTVWSWGHNQYGQIGDDSFEDRHTPTRVRHRGRVTAIAAGAYHAAALLETGSVLTWGRGDNGQLGTGGYEHTPLPAPVIDVDDAEAIGAGSYHLLIRRGDGSVWGWGLDAQGALGDGTSNHSHAYPVAASGFRLTD